MNVKFPVTVDETTCTITSLVNINHRPSFTDVLFNCIWIEQ